MPYTILITGAGSGLGRDLARCFVEAGHNVIATDRETTDGVDIELDVTNVNQIETVLSNLESPVDVLINNAGLQHVAPLEKFEPGRWSELVDVMLNGTARMTRAVLPGMRERGFGRIVNIGSIHSLVASPFKSAYVAAKHGLLGFAKTIALETGDVDITINTLCPSYIRTPLVEKQIAQQAAAHGITEDEVIETIMLEPMPKKAFITPEEVAGAIEFLLSPAARNITGQAIAIDGGWTAR